MSCFQALMEGACEPLSPNALLKYDEQDRKLRTDARRIGLTQPKVRAPAKRTRVRAVPEASPNVQVKRRRLRQKTKPYDV